MMTLFMVKKVVASAAAVSTKSNASEKYVLFSKETFVAYHIVTGDYNVYLIIFVLVLTHYLFIILHII